jgi:hypothetical protein
VRLPHTAKRCYACGKFSLRGWLYISVAALLLISGFIFLLRLVAGWIM